MNLRDHLIEAGLSGNVATSPGNVVGNCHKLVAGDPMYTFGLSDWQSAGAEEVVDVVRDLCGSAAVDGPPEGLGYIDPDTTMEGVRRHRDALATAVAEPGRVLLATGHPTGLLPHYQHLGRHLAAAGWEVLHPLDDTILMTHTGRVGIRFLGPVGCAWLGGELLHRHRSDLMEAMLEDTGPPDLVVADHGFAGAAIERDLPTLAIADVNDPALPLAQARGRTEDVLVIDDNLAPRAFEPVTAAILGEDDL